MGWPRAADSPFGIASYREHPSTHAKKQHTMTHQRTWSTRHFAKPLLFALVPLIALLSLAPRSVQAADYNYPYHDPFLATATTAILSDDRTKAQDKPTIVHCPGFTVRINGPTL